MQQRRPTDDLAEMERRLREGIPPNAIYAVVFSLMEMVGTGGQYFTVDDLDRLLAAALDNPQLAGVSRSAVLANYGMLRAGMRGDLEGGKALLAQALEITPGASELRLHYAGILLDSGQPELARIQIDMARNSDKLGYQTELIKKLEYLLSLQNDAKK
jgi:hypothetical protein